jgi:hypothetical protein
LDSVYKDVTKWNDMLASKTLNHGMGAVFHTAFHSKAPAQYFSAVPDNRSKVYDLVKQIPDALRSKETWLKNHPPGAAVQGKSEGVQENKSEEANEPESSRKKKKPKQVPVTKVGVNSVADKDFVLVKAMEEFQAVFTQEERDDEEEKDDGDSDEEQNSAWSKMRSNIFKGSDYTFRKHIKLSFALQFIQKWRLEKSVCLSPSCPAPAYL